MIMGGLAMQREFILSMHYIARALSDVQYPINKEDLIKVVGDRDVKVDWNDTKKMEELLKPIKIDNFDNAASLFNALSAVL